MCRRLVPCTGVGAITSGVLLGCLNSSNSYLAKLRNKKQIFYLSQYIWRFLDVGWFARTCSELLLLQSEALLLMLGHDASLATQRREKRQKQQK